MQSSRMTPHSRFMHSCIANEKGTNMCKPICRYRVWKSYDVLRFHAGDLSCGKEGGYGEKRPFEVLENELKVGAPSKVRKMKIQNKNFHCAKCECHLLDPAGVTRGGKKQVIIGGNETKTAIREVAGTGQEKCNGIAADVTAWLVKFRPLASLSESREVEMLVRIIDVTQTLNNLVGQVLDASSKNGMATLRSLNRTWLQAVSSGTGSRSMRAKHENQKTSLSVSACEGVNVYPNSRVIFCVPDTANTGNESNIRVNVEVDATRDAGEVRPPVAPPEANSPIHPPMSPIAQFARNTAIGVREDPPPVTQLEPCSPVNLPVIPIDENARNNINTQGFETETETGENPRLPIVDITWGMSKAAESMWVANQTRYPNTVAHLFADKFPLEKAGLLVKDEPYHEYLVNEFCRIRLIYLEHQYDYAILENEMRTLLGYLETEKGHGNKIRICNEMITHCAIETSDLRNTRASLSSLIQLYQDSEALSDRCEEYISHWIVSLLLRDDDIDDSDSKDVNISLECQLSQMPPGWLETAGVKHGLAVIRALLSNNHCTFFQLYQNSEFHLASGMRSKRLLEPFVRMVRQHALLIWGSSGAPGPAPYLNPARTSVRVILEQLMWYHKESTTSRRNWLLNEARQEMNALGLQVKSISESGPRKNDGSDEYVAFSKHSTPSVKPLPFVDFATVLGFLKSKNVLSMR